MLTGGSFFTVAALPFFTAAASLGFFAADAKKQTVVVKRKLHQHVQDFIQVIM